MSRCQYCASDDHTTSNCLFQTQCFICLQQSCSCITSYMQKIDTSLFTKNYVSECYKCGGQHTVFACPENENLTANFTIQAAGPQFKSGTYKFGKLSMTAEVATGPAKCCICGSAGHDSRGCQVQNFRLHFSKRVFK